MITDAVSYASAPGSFSIDLSIMQAPYARIASGSSPIKKRDISRSCTAWDERASRRAGEPCAGERVSE